MHKKEQDLFFELCKFLNTDCGELDKLLPNAATSRVLGELFYNRMAATAYGTLKAAALLNKVTREFRNSIDLAYQQNLEKNNSFFICLKRLTKILNSKEQKYAMLKGAYLCGIYPAGYRTSNDVDLLVRPEDVSEIGDALILAGFEQGSIQNGEFKKATRREIIESKMTRGETVPYILEVNLPYMRFFEVDINFSLDYKNGDEQVVNSILERAVNRYVNGVKIRIPDRYDFFIHLCTHLYKEGTTYPWVKMKRDMTLYKFSDIYLLSDDFGELGISELFYRAKELEAAEMCACAIIWTDALFGLKNENIVATARKELEGKQSLLNSVIVPSENKIFRYCEKDIKKRFFSDNRTELLEEYNEKA